MYVAVLTIYIHQELHQADRITRWQLALRLQLPLLLTKTFLGEVLSNFPSPSLTDMMVSVEDGDDPHSMEPIPDNLEVFLVPRTTILDHCPNLLDSVGWDSLVGQGVG